MAEFDLDQVLLRVAATHENLNSSGGTVFGGWIMGQLDIAASIPAVHIADGRVLTKAVNQIEFKHVLRLGDLLSIYAREITVGRTSIVVGVEGVFHSLSNKSEAISCVTGEFVFVAVDDKGKPRSVLS